MEMDEICCFFQRESKSTVHTGDQVGLVNVFGNRRSLNDKLRLYIPA